MTTAIKFLHSPTSTAWIEQAIAHLDTILLDHSHCERKAAGVALNLMFRYPSSAKLVRALTAIAQEELEHFEQVNQWLDRRGIALAPLVLPTLCGRTKGTDAIAGTRSDVGCAAGIWLNRGAQS